MLTILDDVSLQVAAGETVAVVGASGAISGLMAAAMRMTRGKTDLVRTLPRRRRRFYLTTEGPGS